MTASGWGHEWLAAALEGGLPEPHRDRWQPLRVGIIGLWEYDDAEFWFADGRLVLRGGNGAGKTKVLELTTLMLLRGEVSPSVLDPFGSQHRTMRFNLLPTGEGDDPRPPADSGLGYAWAEFGRLDGDGEARFFVCGMGMSARRGTGTTGVTTWQFVTGLRPGKELQLTAGGRALEQKELRKLDGVYLPGSAAAYRERLGHELFGLAAASYDNLTDLLKQLRKPKLGERLSPALLEETLRDALPPLATHEVTQLAEGWDHLETLRGAVEQTQQAAAAVAQFVREGWRPWARAVLRQRADEFTQATTALDNTTRARNEAQKTLAAATQQVATAQHELAESKQRQNDCGTQLRELMESATYLNAVSASQRVQELRGAVFSLQGQVAAAERRSADAEQSYAHAKEWLDEGEKETDAIRSRVAEQETSLRKAAPSAGLVASADAHLPDRDTDALLADYQTRLARFDRLDALRKEHAAIERQSEQSGQLVLAAEEEVRVAEADEAQAARQVERDAETLRQQIRDWAEAATVAGCSARLVEDWCDQIGELTVIDAESGVTQPGSSVVDKMRNQVSGVRRDVAERREGLSLERSPVFARRQEVASELEAVQARTESSPPAPTLWARRERPGVDDGLGAPLWRLVNPVDGLDDDVLARLEAAAAASGLLDAWVSADGQVDTVDGRLLAEVQLSAGGAVGGRSLLAVLEPDGACGIEPDVVRGVLGAVAWHDTVPADDGDWLAADGSWRVGGITGRAEPAGPASYLGAAARAAAREREMTRLQGELAELDARLTGLNERIDNLDHSLKTLDREEAALPSRPERELAGAVGRWADRSRRRTATARNLVEKRTQHQEDLTRRDQAWAAFADYATAHHFDLHDVDRQGAAIRAYGIRLQGLSSALELLAVQMKTLDEAKRRCAEQEASWQAAVAEAAALTEQHRQATLRLATAEDALDVEHAEQLRRKDALDGEITELRMQIEQLNGQLMDARGAEGAATATLDSHEGARANAEQSRDTAMAALWAAVDRGFAEPLGLIAPESRAVQAAREFASGVRKDITLREQAADVDRAWGRCTRGVEQLRQRLLPNRDARVDDEDSGALPRIEVLVTPDRGWLAPPAAADALAERVSEQQERFDAEQQRVLTTLLGSAFIEHLKDRLDYTAHTFQRINDQLAGHSTRQGHVVRIQYEADPKDPDAGAVVKALRQGYQQLTQERQDMVRDFLRRQIETAREDADAEGAADWKDQLAQALDYRRWLRLTLQYRQGAAGTWALFDAAKHAAKSGGEKVVLLAQPLFAAAVVAYDAADGRAPRCVWLDEAMTGVDATVKASFMGLTVDFELDVMLTAHDEWCTYATVPAVAIYDLARQPNIAGVDSQPYLWCGGELQQIAVDRLGVAQPSTPAISEGLFAEEFGD
ncbi:TIGR02680 family protein [Mycolicibacter kumamotonensis]|jgi:uncharacterized protein (TIGR02680 family)|uniref:TIGR02680 family protein n=1 Tax=Mycolicibacter kumamotonensis TaxID=354243 RepID=A0A1B8SDV1_9MYCO|nr:TIGR02680 family protein [Mycolicibacter kumamotonensis]OBY30920.1 hypothetical protein ACT18_15080 [Mycolicibacter kumamotonensis]